MNRKLLAGIVIGLIAGLALATLARLPRAQAQKGKPEAQWEYKVGWFSYNPGEKMNDEQRRVVFEKALNEKYAPEGWEPVSIILERNVVQTVGGAVVTRDSVSFVAFRRPKR